MKHPYPDLFYLILYLTIEQKKFILQHLIKNTQLRRLFIAIAAQKEYNEPGLKETLSDIADFAKVKLDLYNRVYVLLILENLINNDSLHKNIILARLFESKGNIGEAIKIYTGVTDEAEEKKDWVMGLIAAWSELGLQMRQPNCGGNAKRTEVLQLKIGEYIAYFNQNIAIESEPFVIDIEEKNDNEA